MENIIDPDTLEDWRKAGKIASEILQYGKTLIKKDASMLEVIKKIEKKIHSVDAEPSFPAQISCDEIAAHFCPTKDTDVIFDEQVASLDVGVHINGCQGDNALTVDLSGKYTDLIKASREAVDEAIKVVQVGTQVSEVGKVIAEVIESYGYKPIRNLSGHGMNEYEIHVPPTIPNYEANTDVVFEEGMIVAIEPFATDGIGLIHEKGVATVFSQVKNSGARSPFARNILKTIRPLNGLPFTTHWLTKKMSLPQVKMGMSELIRNNIIHQYPPLVEKDNGICSQAEHTIYVGDKVEILTKF